MDKAEVTPDHNNSNTDQNLDRFSELPPRVLHQISSFLGLVDLEHLYLVTPKLFAPIQFFRLCSRWVHAGCHLGEWISSRFTSLKTLILENIRLSQNLSITSSSLMYLTISHCRLGDDEYFLYVQCPSLEDLRVEGIICKRRDPFALPRKKLHCTIECKSMKTLLFHDCHFELWHLDVTGPSLQDLQVTKCFIEAFSSVKISAEALCTLSMDMILHVLASGFTAFEIHPQSLQNFKRVTLKLATDDEEEEIKYTIREGLLQVLQATNYTNVLELDIRTIKDSDLKEVEVVFHNLCHLEVTIDGLENLCETNIAAFIKAICSASVGLKTVTIKHDKCQSDDDVRLLKTALESVRREIPAAIEIKCLERPIISRSQDGGRKTVPIWRRGIEMR